MWLRNLDQKQNSSQLKLTLCKNSDVSKPIGLFADLHTNQVSLTPVFTALADNSNWWVRGRHQC